jgi:hypothetical protein
VQIEARRVHRIDRDCLAQVTDVAHAPVALRDSIVVVDREVGEHRGLARQHEPSAEDEKVARAGCVARE